MIKLLLNYSLKFTIQIGGMDSSLLYSFKVWISMDELMGFLMNFDAPFSSRIALGVIIYIRYCIRLLK